MILEEIYINQETRCSFHRGLNIILGRNYHRATDEPRKRSDTNGIGKSIIVLTVKHVLCGDTEGAFAKSFYSEGKYWAQLEVSIGERYLVLIRPLWVPLSEDVFVIFEGTLKQHLDILADAQVELASLASKNDAIEFFEGIAQYRVFKESDYRREISRLENIDYSETNINFSSLLDYIARDEKTGFSDPIDRPRRTTWVQYRAIQYLFGLPFTIEESAKKLKESEEDLKVERSSLWKKLESREATTFDLIANKEAQIRRAVKSVQQSISAVKISESLEDIRKQYQEAKQELINLNTKINKNEKYVESHKANVKNLKEREDALSQLLKIEDFYQDLLEFFPEQLKENIAGYRDFFESVAEDRKKYYSDLVLRLNSELRHLRANQEEVQAKVDELARHFGNTKIVGDIAALTAKEERLKTDLRDLSESRELLLKVEDLDDQILKIERDREDLLKKGKKERQKKEEQRKETINLFQKLMFEVYGSDDGGLEFDYVDNKSSSIAGRSEVHCTIPSQDSHGRTYSRINLFDLVWFLRPRDSDEFDPNFLIHDGSYCKPSPEVTEAMLEAAKTRIGQSKQYIITANENEIPDIESYGENICIELDGSRDDGKWFHQQFG